MSVVQVGGKRVSCINQTEVCTYPDLSIPRALTWSLIFLIRGEGDGRVRVRRNLEHGKPYTIAHLQLITQLG